MASTTYSMRRRAVVCCQVNVLSSICTNAELSSSTITLDVSASTFDDPKILLRLAVADTPDRVRTSVGEAYDPGLCPGMAVPRSCSEAFSGSKPVVGPPGSPWSMRCGSAIQVSYRNPVSAQDVRCDVGLDMVEVNGMSVNLEGDG